MKKGILIAKLVVLVMLVAFLTLVCHTIVIGIIDYVVSL